jgi:drug/metabolite transporter (DMT)-like permease
VKPRSHASALPDRDACCCVNAWPWLRRFVAGAEGTAAVVPKSLRRCAQERETLRRAYLYTLLAVAMWTTGPVGAKAALLAVRDGARLTPMQVAFWPIALGWVALAVLLIAQRRIGLIGAIAPRGWPAIILMGLSGWAVFSVSLNMAYARLSLPEALIISYLNPMFVVLFQGRWFGVGVRPISGWEQRPEIERRPSALRLAVGLAAGLVGVAVIAAGGSLSAVGVPRSAAGAAAALVSAVAWGVYSNLGRFVAVRPGREGRGLADVQNVAAMVVGIVVMGGFLGAEHSLAPPRGFTAALYLGGLGPARVDAWAPIIAMAVLNFAIGYTVWLRALEEGHRLGQAHRLPPLTYGTLVLAIVAGWLVFREPIGPGFWQGAALIAAGNIVTLWPERSGERERNR